MAFTGFYIFWIFVIGLCIGSFLNVVILRGFSGESIVLPPSKCPKCKHKLAPWDNIPVFSYLFLRGKCRYCEEKISPQYPIIELLTGLIFVLLFLKFGLGLKLIFLLIASCLMIVVAVCDIKEKVIFDLHAVILGVLGLIYNLFNIGAVNPTKITIFAAGLQIGIWQSFIYAVLGLIAGIIFMEALARLPILFTGKRAFGEGDTYIAAAFGALFGISNLIVILILSLIIQVMIVLPMYLVKLFKQKKFKLFSSFILFFALVFLIKAGEMFSAFKSQMFYWFAFALLVCIGFYVCRKIFEEVKEGSSLTYLPFGPALILSAFIVMLMWA